MNGILKYETLLCLLMLASSSLVEGHGRLIDPAARASLWRFGYKGAVVHYNDNELNCGGFANQVSHAGKCGVCGDPYQGPRENEAGGKYAKGIVARTYTEGDVIDVKVDVTANHLGWFEFRICANDNPKVPVTQECLDQNLLRIAEGAGTSTRHAIGSTKGEIITRLRLPGGLGCTQCVLQWRYHAGNSWGVDADTNQGCVGCGPQEEFYGCADIVITPKKAGHQSTAVSKRDVTTTASGVHSNSRPANTEAGQHTDAAQKTESNPHTTPATVTQIPKETTSMDQGEPACKPVGVWAAVPGMRSWCETTCAAGYCPRSHCRCNPNARKPQTPVGCRPVGGWAAVAGMQKWCERNCAAGYCPASHCRC